MKSKLLDRLVWIVLFAIPIGISVYMLVLQAMALHKYLATP